MTETPVFPRDQAVPWFVAETILFVFLAHALAFFLHEYSHAITAWFLGFKADPLALMGAANLWSYAPIRTITTHGDMAEMARGLHVSPWLLLPFVTLPSILVMYSFFFRLVVPNWAWLFAGGPVRPVFGAAMTGLLYFGFFGAAGLFGSYGDVCALLSIVSLFVLLPLSVVFCLLATGLEVIGFGQDHGRDGGAPA